MLNKRHIITKKEKENNNNTTNNININGFNWRAYTVNMES